MNVWEQAKGALSISERELKWLVHGMNRKGGEYEQALHVVRDALAAMAEWEAENGFDCVAIHDAETGRHESSLFRTDDDGFSTPAILLTRREP